MRCERFREAISARFDGEPLGMSAAALESHLASCTDCARWSEAAARATRLSRLDVRPVPDIADDIAAAVVLPVRRVLRRRRVLRAALLLVGGAQLVVGLAALTGNSIGMAMAAHAAHETAAWNLALAAAFGAVALVPRRAAGLIPLLGTFLLVLGVMSIHDYASGAVPAGRLATHLAALIGLVLLLALDRAERALPPGGFGTAAGSAPGDSAASGLRTVA